MPSWKKVVTSGSNAHLNHITASSYTGSFVGDGSGLTNVSATIADESITLAKLAHADANTVLVRDANSAGDPSFKEVTNTQILIGDGTGFTAAALSGDVTMTNAGVVSVADNKIGNSELKQNDDITLQSLTTTNNISGSTIEGQTLVADVFLSSPSASITNLTNTNITSSGNISGSSTSTIKVGGDITTNATINATSGDFGDGDISNVGAIFADRFAGDVNSDHSFRIESDNLDLRFDDTSLLKLKETSAEFSTHITASRNISGSLTSTLEIGGHATIGAITASSYTGSFVGDGSGLTSVTSTVDIDGLGALGGTGVAQSDKFIFSDGGTEKSITFSNLEDAIFGNVSGEATIAAGGALTIAANSIGNNELKQDDDITLQSLTTTNNISGSTIEGQTIVTDVFLSAPSASITNLTNTNITSSGNISSSKNVIANQLTASAFQFIGSGTAELEVEGHITASGNISASGGVTAATVDTEQIFNTNLKIGRDSTDLIDFASADNTIRFRVNNSDEMNLVSDSLKPHSNDGLALGASNRQWSDLFLAEGGVINFDNGDVTITQTENNLAIAGTDSTTFVGNISASGNITGSIIEGQTLTADVFLSSPSASLTNITTTNITASGNISGSTIEAQTFVTDVFLSAPSASITNLTNTNITSSGHISASGEITTHVGQHIFVKTSTTDADAKGDIVYLGGTTSMDAGKIYHFKNDGTWEIANADAASTSDGLLAVALGAASDINGMLLRGTVTLDHDPGAIGAVLFLQSDNAGTPGQATATAPSANNNVVRVVGYLLDSSNGQIWFNPSSTFVEVSA